MNISSISASPEITGGGNRRSINFDKMIYRSKAPLRIGLAGGGTDVSPYCDLYGGAILNVTLSLYAHATIEPLEGKTIVLQGMDRNEEQRFEEGVDLETLPIDGKLDLLKGVYNRIRKEY